MRKLFLLLLFSAIVFSSCSDYSYNDYTEASSYRTPEKPEDTLFSHCAWSLDEVCLLTNLLETDEEKKLFIAESIGNNSFENINEWNGNIDFGKYPPNGSSSSTNIKDAWISIAYIDPSVYDNGTYILNETSNWTIKHDFSFVVDTRKLPGDCKSNFRICGYDYDILVNSSSSQINATMNIQSEYQIDRYHWVVHCSMFSCWVTCDYYRTDTFTDHLTVSDSKNIRYENFTINSNYSVADYYNNLAEVLVDVNNSRVYFDIGNSSFSKETYEYRIRYENAPYNILVKEIIPVNQTSFYGISILDRDDSIFRLLVPYNEDCTLTIAGHFISQSFSGCNATASNHTKTIEEPETPEICNSFFYAVSLFVALYILYLFFRGRISHA